MSKKDLIMKFRRTNPLSEVVRGAKQTGKRERIRGVPVVAKVSTRWHKDDE